jgi:hypothetical protein
MVNQNWKYHLLLSRPKKGDANGPNSTQDTGVEFLNRIKDHSAYFYKKLHSCKKHKKYDISYLIEQHRDTILVPREDGQLPNFVSLS